MEESVSLKDSANPNSEQSHGPPRNVEAFNPGRCRNERDSLQPRWMGIHHSVRPKQRFAAHRFDAPRRVRKTQQRFKSNKWPSFLIGFIPSFPFLEVGGQP
jgi:hypothetical protein